MRLQIFSLTVLAVVGLSSCTRTVRADRAALLPPGPAQIVAAEPGVVPPGTSLVVRTNDTVSTDRAFRDTSYDASLAEDVLDQNGRVLIPRESPVDLVVFSFGFLGPGGAGTTELVLGVRAVAVNGVSYPVQTAEPERDGGLAASSHTAKLVGGGGATDRVLTRGSRINVPTGTLLRFQSEHPIRLRGYRR